ncbi:hypothetical protein [Streptomyces sp. V2]|uniref:hypothetical protein n=1 Tax=Streptomyces sp. V2 TaxID=1424099 RepID=UPI001058165A|nr:hypothetical protein [Streptomyces sp. V2]
MAEFTSETVTRTVRRWIVPAAEPWGAACEEVSKAWTAAAIAYRDAHGLPQDAPVIGDALRFRVADDRIVIQFETEEGAS